MAGGIAASLSGSGWGCWEDLVIIDPLPFSLELMMPLSTNTDTAAPPNPMLACHHVAR
ncbi:hypothetical protein DAI22_06g138700 [Oryza sativa Japonica Group]|jgi:hypothetical protein|nr:hypothetical protein DAI22_06g138700 [Oryza sativa Japonica Group]